MLEEQFPETVTTQPELLAHHFTEAGLQERAVSYWQQAGQRASERSAYAEAISHLTKGLELLKMLPDSSERVQHELHIQTGFGTALIAMQGYAAPEVEQAYSRALELCRQMDEPTELFPVLGGLWQFYSVRAEHQTARELAEQLLTLAQSAQDPALLLGAHNTLGQTFYWLGEFVHTRDHMEQSIALYNPKQHRTLALLLGGEDPGVTGRGSAAWTLWLLGYPEQALQRIQEAHTLAQELGSPFALAWALGAEAYGQAGRPEEGLTVLAEAHATVRKTRERYFEAELHRIRGELLLQQGVPDEQQVETHFQQALVTARHQQAKSLELRAAMCLARMWKHQGKRIEAYDLLAPIYGWFTEGFDTAELKDAKALLAELA